MIHMNYITMGSIITNLNVNKNENLTEYKKHLDMLSAIIFKGVHDNSNDLTKV